MSSGDWARVSGSERLPIVGEAVLAGLSDDAMERCVRTDRRDAGEY